MRYVPDLLIRGADESLVAAIEVKGAGMLTPERAKGIFAGYREASGGVPPAYFLVLSPERGFIWKRDALRTDDSANSEFDFGEVLADYLDPEKDTPRVRSLEYVVFRWLFAIATGARQPNKAGERSLAQIGFIAAIRDARVSFGLAA
jgi:hypothetical protein